jgi:hydrogenase maturation factor
LNGGDVLITTDGFTVQPLEFPGGDIGERFHRRRFRNRPA